MECAGLSRGRLRDLENDRSERSKALRNLLTRLAQQIIDHSNTRTHEIDDILCRIDQTIAAQKVYDATARLKVNLASLPHQQNKKAVPSFPSADDDNSINPRRRVAFPEMSPPRRRVGFAADEKESPPAIVHDEDSGTVKAGDQTTCFTPFTPAPLCMQHIDDDDEDNHDNGESSGGLLRSPDKCSVRKTASTNPLEGKVKDNVKNSDDYQLADFLTLKPSESLAKSHGPSLHAALESVLLLQNQLSQSIGTLEREVLPDLRSVRILVFRAGQKAEKAIAEHADALDSLQSACDELYKELNAMLQLKPVTTRGDEPFFHKVKQFQTVLTSFLAAVLESLGDINNAEVKCSRLFAHIGYSWQDTFARSMAETTKRLARIRPAFFQNDGSVGMPMTGGSPLSGFPFSIPQQQSTEKTEQDPLSPRWPRSMLSHCSADNLPVDDQYTPSCEDVDTPRASQQDEEMSVRAPLCGRSVRSLHSTFKMEQIPFGSLAVDDELDRTEQVASAKFVIEQSEDECRRVAEDWAAMNQWAKSVARERPMTKAPAFVTLAALCCGGSQ